MTNSEKYLKDEVNVEEFLNAIIEHCSKSSKNSIETFLRAEVKSTLTEDERVILRNIDTMYKYIYREYGSLRVSLRKNGEESEIFAMYDRLFKFIKERRRIRNKGVIEWNKLIFLEMKSNQ